MAYKSLHISNKPGTRLCRENTNVSLSTGEYVLKTILASVVTRRTLLAAWWLTTLRTTGSLGKYFLFQILVEACSAAANSLALATRLPAEVAKNVVLRCFASQYLPMSFILRFFNDDDEKIHVNVIYFILLVTVLAECNRGLRRQLLPETRCSSWKALFGPVSRFLGCCFFFFCL